jgi:hypothetical protein
MPTVRGVRRVSFRLLSYLRLRPHAHCTPRPIVEHCRGDFSVVDQAQGAPAKPAPGRARQAIGEAAVGFSNDEQALIAARQVNAEQGTRTQPDADSKHLARTQLGMKRFQALQALK